MVGREQLTDNKLFKSASSAFVVVLLADYGDNFAMTENRILKL